MDKQGCMGKYAILVDDFILTDVVGFRLMQHKNDTGTYGIQIMRENKCIGGYEPDIHGMIVDKVAGDAVMEEIIRAMQDSEFININRIAKMANEERNKKETKE